LQFQVYYVFFAVHPLREFVDLCSVSNISVMILLEPQWGFYIHGESIHAHADVSMVEFQENLQRESRGDLPARGLGGQSQSQTFEVFIGSYLRNYLYACQIELLREMQGTVAAPRVIPRRQMTILRSVQQALHGTPSVFSVQTMHVTQQRNSALLLSVRSAEKSLLGKFGLHAMLDFPPNIMYMNGPFAGDNQGRDMYFFDDPQHFGDALLYGLDIEIFLLYVLLFVSIDTALHNTFISMVIVHFVETALVWYRAEEGEANLCLKSTIDYRFLI
jgi:meckelin